MSLTTPSTRATRPGRSLVVVLLLAGFVLMGIAWASQGGLAFKYPWAFVSVLAIVVDALPVLAMIWLGAAGLGIVLARWLWRDPLHWRWSIILAMGMAAMLMLDWLLAWAGWLNSITAWLVCVIGVLVLGDHVRRTRSKASTRETCGISWLWLLTGPAIGLSLTAAACPPLRLWAIEAFGYDVSSYHLQVPREWLELGGMRGLHHNMFSYLPLLVEAGFTQAIAMHGSLTGAIYTTQLWHLSMALLAAWIIHDWIKSVTGGSGVVGAIALLVVPWTIILGTQAYNEMFVFAFAGAAYFLAFDGRNLNHRSAIMTGSLLAAATLAKMTAGPTFVIPLAIITLLALHRFSDAGRAWSWSGHVRWLVIVALAGMFTLAPYLVRNTLWTGNPVFPFATEALGTGHWSEQVARLRHEHHTQPTHGQSAWTAFRDYWLTSAGYGTLGSHLVPNTVYVVDEFQREGGVPLLWSFALIGAVLGFSQRRTRLPTLAIVITLAFQLAFFMFGTMQHGRFAVYSVWPGCVLVGIGWACAGNLRQKAWRWLAACAAVAFVVAMSVLSFQMFHEQTLSGVVHDEHGQPSIRRLKPHEIINVLEGESGLSRWSQRDVELMSEPVNLLSANAKVCVVADVTRVIYMDRPLAYHSRFDEGLLPVLIRQFKDEPTAITNALREQDFTHVWINWNNLDREEPAIHHDPRVTMDVIRRIAAHWRVIFQSGPVSLYALHPASEREHLLEVLQVNPEDAVVRVRLANMLLAAGEHAQAVMHYEQALRSQPRFVEARFNLAAALVLTGDRSRALAEYDQLSRLMPDEPAIHQQVGKALLQLGALHEAALRFDAALRLNPSDIDSLKARAWLYATNPDSAARHGQRATDLAQLACELTMFADPQAMDVLAAAHAEAGRFDQAMTFAQRAAQAAGRINRPDMQRNIESRLQFYERREPYRLPASP